MQQPKKHEDERGFFQELYHFSQGDKVGQLSWFTINPNEMRGGHFHEDTEEIFIVLSGSCVFLDRQNVPPYIKVPKLLTQGMSAKSKIKMSHALVSSEGATVLCVSNRNFNCNDTDTYQDHDFTKKVKTFLSNMYEDKENIIK